MIKEGCGGICNLALLRQDNICSHQCLNANITTHIRKPLGKSYKLALQFYVPAPVYFLRRFSWVAEFEGLILGPAGVGLDVLGFEVSQSNCWMHEAAASGKVFGSFTQIVLHNLWRYRSQWRSSGMSSRNGKTGEQTKVAVLLEHLDQFPPTQKVVSFDMMTSLLTSGVEMMQFFTHNNWMRSLDVWLARWWHYSRIFGVWSWLWFSSRIVVGVPAGFQPFLTTLEILLIWSVIPPNVLAQKGWPEAVAHHSKGRQISL